MKNIAIQHENGLYAELAMQHYDIEKSASGFTVKLSAPDSRANNEVSLILTGETDIFKLIRQGASTKNINGHIYYYESERLQGGSGGDEFVLKIAKSVGGSSILLTAHIQSEIPPDFSELWRLVESSRLSTST